MADPVLCKICGRRRAKRYCPAVSGDICTLCCGIEREVSLACPLECEFLQEAHRHEKPLAIPENEIAYREMRITEEFLASHEELLLFVTYSLVDAATRTSGAVDTDVIAALQAIVHTYKTLDSGLVYETRPDNLVAASIQRSLSASLDDYRREKQEEQPLSPIRNSDVIGVLVFLLRAGQTLQNGRPKGRMFIDWAKGIVPGARVEERTPSIIL
jgi:hypothetical protein